MMLLLVPEMTPDCRDPTQPLRATSRRAEPASGSSRPGGRLWSSYTTTWRAASRGTTSRPAWPTCFRVIVPDLPGFGESEKPPPSRYRYDFDGFSESLVDLLAALGLGRVSLCGHAMGGAVALTLAATHPHLVDKLVLVNPLVYPPRPDALSRIAGVPVLGPLLFKQLYGRALFGAGSSDVSRRATTTARLRRVDRLFELFDAPAAREAAYATMRAMLDTGRSRRACHASGPDARRVGAHRLAVEHGRRLARELGGARFEVFDCGPSPAEECPRPSPRFVTSFLADTGG